MKKGRWTKNRHQNQQHYEKMISSKNWKSFHYLWFKKTKIGLRDLLRIRFYIVLNLATYQGKRITWRKKKFKVKKKIIEQKKNFERQKRKKETWLKNGIDNSDNHILV
jgi:hypothetical protein